MRINKKMLIVDKKKDRDTHFFKTLIQAGKIKFDPILPGIRKHV